MKSLSAYSSEKGFNVSSLGANAICIKSDFNPKHFFSSLPLWSTWTTLKGELYRHMFSLCLDDWMTGSGNHYPCAVKEQNITQYFYPRPCLEKTNCK